jgi:hypothetical protein
VLPQLAAESVSPEVRQEILQRLLALVEEAQTVDVERNPLVQQLLAGELALKLANVMPECLKLEGPGRTAIAAGLTGLIGREGLLQAIHLQLLGPLLACWTRCRVLAMGLPGRDLAQRLQDRYNRLVRGAMRIARQDRTLAFSTGEAGSWNRQLFDLALALGDEENLRLAALALPGTRTETGEAPKKGTRKKDALPPAAVNSEWAAVAVLRGDWSRMSERLTVLYPNQSVDLELTVGNQVLWSGAWQWEIRRDGETVSPVSSWQATCWVSDEDGDYLELDIALSGGLRLQRHILLTRKDRFLLLADAVLGERSGKIEYQTVLPMSPGVGFQGGDETREGFLTRGRAEPGEDGSATARPRLATVLPLALPEWRCDERVGELKATERGLELHQAIEGRRLFAPLFFDLDRGRFRKRLTWRQVTVAESLEIQPPDVAVGYRVAIGDRQWLVYRSLATPANRTLLGHNLATETLFARFDRKGQVESIIEIE